MAGLSMGGMQTLFITLQHLDLFAYIGSFSGPIIPNLNVGNLTVNSTPEPFDSKTAYGGAFAEAATFNRRVKLFWLGVGTAEPDQFRNGIGGAVEFGGGDGYFEADPMGPGHAPAAPPGRCCRAGGRTPPASSRPPS